MKRLFAAFKIHPDPEFLASYRKLQSAMKFHQIKWVEERNIHVTLKFFGDTPDDQIPGLSRLFNSVAARTSPFGIRLQGLGLFGSRYDPRVIWTGIEPFGELADMMKGIAGDLLHAGYPADRQNLVPHLTLGRIRSVRDRALFDEALERFRNISSSPVKMEEFILFESILHREGPEYIALDHFRLKGY